jgi:hypothetical protein
LNTVSDAIHLLPPHSRANILSQLTSELGELLCA